MRVWNQNYCFVTGEVNLVNKTQTKNKIRDILYKYPYDMELNTEDAEFMTDIIKMHPKADYKIGSGIECFVIRQNYKYPTTRNFWIIRTDGSETDFSYLECISPNTKLAKFKNACRDVVKEYVIDFKCNNLTEDSVCPITGELLKDNVHVDHEPPNTFDVIVNNFIKENNIDVNKVKLESYNDGESGDVFSDAILAAYFYAYHEDNAKLRLVSVKANLSVIKKMRHER